MSKEFKFTKELDIFLNKYDFKRVDDWAYSKQYSRRGIGTDNGYEEIFMNKEFIVPFIKWCQKDLIEENRKLRLKLNEIKRILK